jgi:flagellin
MAQYINTNVAALFAAAALNTSQLALATAQQQLSSGLRINSAKDDPTGLAIAMGIQSQVNGTNQAVLNANNGISTAQTNDGYLAQIGTNLQRLYTIAVETGGASTTEATQLIAENARLNALVVAQGNVVVGDTGATYTTIGASGAAVTNTSIAGISTDITTVAGERQKYGADMSVLGSAVASLQTAGVNLSASLSRIMDTDYATATTQMTTNNILQQAGMAVLAQANQTPNQVLTLLR